jgi:hypothetical protein
VDLASLSCLLQTVTECIWHCARYQELRPWEVDGII